MLRKIYPPLIEAWMLGNYQAKIDSYELLEDTKLQDLDPRYLKELELRAYNATSQLVDKKAYDELRLAYIEIGQLKETCGELRKTINRLNGRAEEPCLDFYLG